MVLTSGMLLAQTSGKISGVITDTQTGEPLIGVNVVVMGTSMGAATDIEGSFFILTVPAGKYDIQASMVGYEKVIQRDVIVNSARTTTADFKLKSTAVEQVPVIIEAVRPDVEPEKTSTSEVIRGEDVQQLAGMRDVSNVIGLAADVTDGHFRGGRDGEELYTLQGMGIVNPLDNTTGLLPIMSAVEEVEVITSGFGVQYGNAQSGVVNITMKEGKPDKWRSHAEVNTRMPSRKYFGANVYDANANQYLKTLLTASAWLNPSQGGDEPGYGYWTRMGSNIAQMFGRDTAAQVVLARALWQQVRKKINNFSYDKNIDYSLEFSTGGPIAENIRMFLAARNATTWPKYPVEHPDINRQLMGNIVSDIADGSSLRVSGAYGEERTNQFPSENTSGSPGFFNFLWDDVVSIQYRKTTNTQIGVRYTEALNQSTFYEIKLNTLLTRRHQGSSPFAGDLTDAQIGHLDIVNTMAQQTIKAPDGFKVGAGSDDFIDDRTNTYSLDASLTSQVTKSHLISTGIQANSYYLDITEHRSMTNDPPFYTSYTAKPYQASIYAQDKMEFQGMIATVGLRWDLWSQNVKYNPNLYAPYFTQTTITGSVGQDSIVSMYVGKAAMNTKSPILARLQPRVGMSFPISITTVFHLNYGAFVQAPSFQYTLDARNQYFPTRSNGEVYTPNQLGNPSLKPQTTYSYDVGVMQGFGEGFTLDVSGYYKNVQDLIQAATYASGSNSYTTYINRAYADIRGFRFTFNKRKGNFIGSLNYQYSVATGKSSTVGSMMPSFTEGQPEDTKRTSTKDILLDFDRTHNILINLGYVSDENFGPKIAGAYLLGDVSISSNSFLRSGRPYTYTAGTGESGVNNMRTPWEYNTNIKISKRLRNFLGVEASVYLEVFNLFDNKILNYDYIFLSNDASGPNRNARLYNERPLEASNGLRYNNVTSDGQTQVTLDQAFLIYSNQPRSLNLGIAVDF
jgi:Outer membrane receptor proteins, mostly Fe transport